MSAHRFVFESQISLGPIMLEKVKQNGKICTPSRIRRILYGFTWGLIFCIAASELGLVSQQLHRGGNMDQHYGSREFKHVLGLTLFTVILTFLLCLGHVWINVGLMAFFVLIADVFWGACAGVIFSSCPYRQNNCLAKDPYHTFHGSTWSEPQFFSQCSRIVAMQGLAWAEWALFLALLCGTIIDTLEIKQKPAKTFYEP